MSVKMCTSSVNQKLMLANFSNGTPVNNFTSNVKLFVNGRNLKRKILVVETDQLDYVSSNVGINSVRQSTDCKQYIGILDKTRNKLHVMDCIWFNMKPTLLGDGVADDEAVNPELEDVAAFDKRKKEMLTMSFGSRKKQTGMETARRLQVEAVDVVDTIQTTLDNMPSDVVEDEIQLHEKEMIMSLNEILPPINRGAATEEEIYSIQDIVSEEDLSHAKEIAQVLANGTNTDFEYWNTNKIYPCFVLKQLKSLPVEPVARLEKCKLLVYYSFLVSLMSIRIGKVSQNNPIPKGLPGPIRKKIIESFFQPQNKGKANEFAIHMTAKTLDKVMAHIIVLALLIDSLYTDAQPLRKDLKMSSKRFHLLAQVCGAHVRKVKHKETSLEIVSLELPLADIIPKKHARKRN